MVILWLLLRLLCQPKERLCNGCPANQERIKVSAVPTLLKSPSSLLARALPTLGSANSANSVNSETISVTDRMKSNNTLG